MALPSGIGWKYGKAPQYKSTFDHFCRQFDRDLTGSTINAYVASGNASMTNVSIVSDSVCFDLQTYGDTTLFAGAVDFSPDNQGNTGTKGMGAPITLADLDIPDPPEAPPSLRVGSQDPGLSLYTVDTPKPTFSWGSSSGATTYSIRVRDKADSTVLKNWSSVGTATGYTYTDGVPMVGAYYFDVVGINGGGTGATSTATFQYIPGYRVSFAGSPDPLAPEHLEIARVQEDVFYVRYDHFGYLVLVAMMICLLSWTLINFAVWSFKLGYS